jgi:hypothetical protein
MEDAVCEREVTADVLGSGMGTRSDGNRAGIGWAACVVKALAGSYASAGMAFSSKGQIPVYEKHFLLS